MRSGIAIGRAIRWVYEVRWDRYMTIRPKEDAPGLPMEVFL